MDYPNISITFREAAATVVKTVAGVLALVFKDSSVATGVTAHVILTESGIPDTLDAANQTLIQQAFVEAEDGVAPSKVIAVCIPSAALDWAAALTYLETVKFDVMTVPSIDDADVAAVDTWAKGMRDDNDIPCLAVLPGTVSDHESIINFDTDDIEVGETTYTANQYLARIAGVIAGLSYKISPTFHVLSEVDDVPHLTKSQASVSTNAGKLILFHDGEKVKIARGITSLTTLTNKASEWQKIKIVRILDKVYRDLKMLIEDSYVGKVSNSYQNKILLIAAINNYFAMLERLELLDSNAENKCQINIDAQRIYLLAQGIDVTVLSNQEIKEYNTADKVFLISTVRPLDAIEDVALIVNI
jgi:hypothetical protein